MKPLWPISRINGSVNYPGEKETRAGFGFEVPDLIIPDLYKCQPFTILPFTKQILCHPPDTGVQLPLLVGVEVVAQHNVIPVDLRYTAAVRRECENVWREDKKG